LQRRRREANAALDGRYVHTINNPARKNTPGKQAKKQGRQRNTGGYRPGRKGASGEQ
jgi:hypothetical protein